MTGLNLYVLVLGGLALGGILVAIARDAHNGTIRWPMAAVLLLAALAIMYGITQLPNLGG